MKKIILSTIIMAAAFASNAQAQHKVFLNKGTDNVEAVSLGADDYIAFSRPEGVPEMKDVEVASTETGKTMCRTRCLLPMKTNRMCTCCCRSRMSNC